MTRCVIEMCSGYGGATAGMIAAGLQIEMTYDLWPVAVDAHRRWHPNAPCEVRDVKTITPEELRGRIVWASLPCQPWSTANRVRRGKSHPSYYSLAHFARQVQYSHMAILENVPGLLHEKDGQAELRELERECARLGLNLSINLLRSADYGVPQLRRRAIILINAPLTLFSSQSHSWGKLSDAPRATFGGGADSSEYRAGRKLQAAPTASEGKGRGVESISGWAGAKKLHRSPNATEHSSGTSTNPDTGEINFKGRTPAQNAALQGVPLEHIAHLPITHQYTLIGNAVPPAFSEGIVRQILRVQS